MCTWDELAHYMRERTHVVKEWDDGGFIFDDDSIDSFTQRLFLGRLNPGFGAVDHVVIEGALGSVAEVDLAVAARGCRDGLAGIVIDDDLVTVRDSRCLETLSISHLAALIGSVSGIVMGYRLATEP